MLCTALDRRRRILAIVSIINEERQDRAAA
jgi:hypothetical protein